MDEVIAAAILLDDEQVERLEPLASQPGGIPLSDGYSDTTGLHGE